ncbi:hypothetical protein JKF63_06466 [Porcisia hertigi]|uniref:ATP-dependent DNA helicase n=1 Tax=Porcisia hertigi TaxID=2761500 RepID=A0A836LK04_9TRYP|nr:hypothetical protein JKF63_06466 [Porcisia hertigi]
MEMQGSAVEYDSQRPVGCSTADPQAPSFDSGKHGCDSHLPLMTLQSSSPTSTSPAPLLSMRYSGRATSSSHSRATYSEEASAQNVTLISSSSSLLKPNHARLSGSEAPNSTALSDAQTTVVREGVTTLDADFGAAMSVLPRRCSSPVRSSVGLATEHIRHPIAAEKAVEAEEVHSCMTLSSTVTSPGTPPVPTFLQQLAHCVLAPPHPPQVLLTLSSSEGHCGLPASAPPTEEEPAPLLSCSNSLPSPVAVLTPPALMGEASLYTPSTVSPAPSKPPTGPSAAVATAMTIGAGGGGEAPEEFPLRPSSLFDSDLGGRPIDPRAATTWTSTKNFLQGGCTQHSPDPRALPPVVENSDLPVAKKAAPAAPRTTTTAATTTSTTALSEPALSIEQQYAFHTAVREQRSVFITGGAGTGKSHLLRTIIRALPASPTFVTATTGIAALNLSGTTLHSFVGCGIPSAKSTRDSLLGAVYSKQRCVRSWRVCQTLIIDEVSMLEPSFFDLVDYIAREVRNRPEEPFGGIQLILSGDFLQLPPVSRERRGSSPQFCFEAESWLAVNPKICLLTTPFRQRNLRFFSILNEMRFGELRPESVELLYSINTTERVHFVRRSDVAPGMKAEEGDDSSEAVRLGLKRGADLSAEASAHGTAACKREGMVTGMRQTHLELVNGFGRAIDAPFDGYTILRSTRAEVDAENQRYYRQLNTEIFMYRGFHTGKGDFPEGTLAKVVHLRKGCRVMLIKNFDPRLGLVNGSTGTITDFLSFSRGYFFKTQGIKADDARSICVGRGTNSNQPHTMLPVVSFDLRAADGSITTREVIVEPQEWKEMLGTREVSRSVQIPLILAYAITIHKSQGMSLTQVDIDFTNVFESGQSYVALSRCTDMEYVRLHGFDAHRVSTNSIALAYYKALALQQQRLHWLRSHVPRAVAAAETIEAFSCTPYGYVLPKTGQGFLPNEEQHPMPRLTSRNDMTSPASKLSSSCCCSPSSADGDRLDPDDTGLECRPHRKEGERHDGGSDRRSGNYEGLHSLCQSPEGRARSDNPGAVNNLRAHADAALGEEPDDDSDDMNETVRLDTLRRRITPLLTMASMVRRLVTRQAIPLHRVYNTRIVVDVHSLFQLITGPESAVAFDVLFGERDNMMRVPLSVYTLVTEAAAYRSTSESLSRSASLHLPVNGSCCRRGDASVRSDTSVADAAGVQGCPFDAPLLTASDVAAEALAVMERAKQDFFLDVQRPDQRSPLPEPDPSWLRFAEVLPLLRRRHGGSQVNDGAMADAVKGVDDACREVDFILNRDPREIPQQQAILEYAIFLQASFGQDVVICTDSVLLAAYALAWRLRVVSTDYLCSHNGGSDGMAA